MSLKSCHCFNGVQPTHCLFPTVLPITMSFFNDYSVLMTSSKLACRIFIICLSSDVDGLISSKIDLLVLLVAVYGINKILRQHHVQFVDRPVFPRKTFPNYWSPWRKKKVKINVFIGKEMSLDLKTLSNEFVVALPTAILL